MTRAATFRQSQVTKALKGAQAAGVKVVGIEIGADGSISMRFGNVDDIERPCGGNPWDEVLSNGQKKRPA